MDWGGTRQNETWADLPSGRNFRLQFEKEGARPRLIERRYRLSRGAYNRLAVDDRVSHSARLSETQFCLNTMKSRGGSSASQMVFRPNPADLFMRQDGDSVRMGVEDASTSWCLDVRKFMTIGLRPGVCPGVEVAGDSAGSGIIRQRGELISSSAGS